MQKALASVLVGINTIPGDEVNDLDARRARDVRSQAIQTRVNHIGNDLVHAGRDGPAVLPRKGLKLRENLNACPSSKDIDCVVLDFAVPRPSRHRNPLSLE